MSPLPPEVLPWFYEEPETTKRYKVSLPGLYGSTWFVGDTYEEVQQCLAQFCDSCRDGELQMMMRGGFSETEAILHILRIESQFRIEIHQQMLKLGGI